MKPDHKKDREYLLGLVDSLGISKKNLRKDELGYWNLYGRRGKIDTDGEFWYVRISCKSRTIWQNVKHAISFMVKWQDGDDEGALRLDRYPTEEEANKIRKILGFSRRVQPSEEYKELLRERLRMNTLGTKVNLEDRT